MSERLRRDEIPERGMFAGGQGCGPKAQIPEREGFLQGRELQIVCKAPAASGHGSGARSAAIP